MIEQLIEKYIDQLSSSSGKTKDQVLKHIDDCLKKLTIKYNKPYTVLHDELFNEENLVKCLKLGKTCSELDIKKCQESCHCVWVENEDGLTSLCFPRYFENAEEINSDPDKYLVGMSTERLEELMNLADYLYHNYEGGGLTDNSYDTIRFTLEKRLKLKGKALSKIGALPIKKLRTKLPYFMGSLEKIKPGTKETLAFLDQLTPSTPSSPSPPKELVWSLKLDGVSGMLVYSSDGKVKNMYTRGDGVIGGDISYLIPYITKGIADLSISATEIGTLAVRGEFVISKNIFNEKYSTSYSNPRTFVSSKINSGTVSDGLMDISFVAYEIVDVVSNTGERPDPTEPSRRFRILQELQFLIPDFGILKMPTMFEILELYRIKRAESIYLIDGLVLNIDLPQDELAQNNITRPVVAFKAQLEEQQRQSKIINVEWNISRHGRFVPVAIYENVYIDGARLHRASAYNAAHVRDWNLGKGTNITVIRSGDVIPIIKDVKIDNTLEPIFPSKEKGSWTWKNKIDIVLEDIESNRWVQIQRLVYFFTTIGVPKLREKTLENLWEAGHKTIQSISKLKEVDFMKIKGIGKVKSKLFYEEIHKTMRTTPIDRYIAASSFEIGLGRKLIKQLFRSYPDILKDDSKVITANLKKNKIAGFGPKRIEKVAEIIPKFKEFLYSLGKEDINAALENDAKRRRDILKNGMDKKIKDKLFVLTGFYGKIDYKLEDYIYDNGGDFVDSVTSGVECVITANVADITTKMTTAYSMKIPVYTIPEFIKRYNLTMSVDTELEENDIVRDD